MEPVKDNMQKYENYKEQMQRLKKALKEGFNLEAIFIEDAIMEDRFEAVLRTAGKWNDEKHSRRTLKQKAGMVKKLAEEKKSLAHRYFSDELFQRVEKWADIRNGLIHALVKQSFQTGEVRAVAEDGKALLDKVKSKADSYIKAKKKQDQAKEEANHG